MKIIKLISFFIYINLSAQTNKILYVEYKTVKAVSENKQTLEPEYKKGLDTYINALESIEFALIANDTVSIFKKIDKMGTETPHPLSKIISNGIFYTNLISKEKITIENAFGENFSNSAIRSL